MKQLRSVEQIADSCRVMLSMDMDLPMKDGIVVDNNRLIKSLPTIKFLLDKKCKVIIVGKLGRPVEKEEKYSLKPVYAELMSLIDEHMGTSIAGRFVEEALNVEIVDEAVDVSEIVCLENMKFFENEPKDGLDLTRYLATLAEVYVQDAFAMAHRTSSYLMVSTLLPVYFGFDFIKEYETIGSVIESPRRPVIVILGGAKIDKLDYLPGLQLVADLVVLVGVLPKEVNLGMLGPKVVVGSLTASGLDIDLSTLDKISPILKEAGTIIWAGSAGKWEEEMHSAGTKGLADLIGQSTAFRIVAGGDTVAALRKYNGLDKIDLVCSGGGAMLEFLCKKTLPMVEMIENVYI